MTDNIKVEVGQVWQVGDRLVMVSYRTPKQVFVGKAEKRGQSYAIVEKPTVIRSDKLRRGTLILDTEAA